MNFRSKSIFARSLVLVAILAGFGLGYGLGYGFGARQHTNQADSFQSESRVDPQPAIGIARHDAINASINSTPMPSLEQEEPVEAREQETQELEATETVDASIFDNIKQSFYEEAVELIVDWMSTSDLVPLIAGFSGVAEDQIWTMQDARAFGKQLAAFVLEDCGPLNVPLAVPALRFADVAHNRSDFASIHSIARRSLDRVYAHFVLPSDYPWDSVLVRWCRAAPLRNYLFGNYEINQGASLNYVWFAPQVAEAGDYYVHIWSIDETPVPLASGSYEVVE